MPDILLIQPPIEDFYLTAKRTLPYGLASIAAAMRQAGFSVAILDGLATTKSRVIPWPDTFTFLEPFYGRPDGSPFGLFHHFRHYGYSLQHLANQARQSGAFLIGISSLFSAYSNIALETAAAVKKACPQARIVMGGHHPTALPEAVMAHGAVDFVLRGEGELGLPLLAKALHQGRPVSNVPGLVWRRDDGTLAVAEPAMVPDLAQLPVPAFDLVPWSFYQRSGRASLSLSASRGCPLHCTYCAVNAGSHHGFRKRSVAAVMAELAAVEQCKPIGFIDFEDEHLCADKQWFLSLMQAIALGWGPRKPELRAMNGLYAPALDAAVIAAMQRAGFGALNLALITTDTQQLKRFKRSDLRPHMDRVLALAQDSKLSAIAYLIVGGPCQEPCASVADLLYLAERRVLAGVSVFYPAPGSYDYTWCQQTHCLPEDFGRMRATALPLAHLTDRTQTVTLLRLGRILNFMKALVDQGREMPTPARVPTAIDTHTARQEMGCLLLAGFLKDGGIRGIDDQGRIYAHRVDAPLVDTFLQGLKTIRLRGAVI
jgi:anaerobic magnesium-protoporphyrin IX monomethyl ester cyclase